MKMTRRENEKRERAVLRFFVENPDATGDEAQKALTSGTLTGEKGPPMGIGRLFRVKRQAAALVRDGAAPPTNSAAMAPGVDAMQVIRNHAGEIQRALAALSSIAEVRITRDGARVVRLNPTEEEL